jgi:hypothetical protein
VLLYVARCKQIPHIGFFPWKPTKILETRNLAVDVHCYMPLGFHILEFSVDDLDTGFTGPCGNGGKRCIPQSFILGKLTSANKMVLKRCRFTSTESVGTAHG